MRNPMPLIVTLCLICIMFGWKTQQAWFSAPPVVNSEKPPSIDLGPEAMDPVPRKDVSGAVVAVSSRSLFRPDRSFFSEETGDAQGGRTLSRLSMIGLMTFGGDMKGIVIDKENPQTGRLEVRVGDSLLGYKVKTVSEEGIVLAADGRELMLHLYAGAPTVDERSLRSQNTPRAPLNRAPAPRGGVPAQQQHRISEGGVDPGENQ